jgi:hypothetical protein
VLANGVWRPKRHPCPENEILFEHVVRRRKHCGGAPETIYDECACMADREQLQILKKGVPQWNEWRRQNRDVVPDLSGTDLRSIQLIGADFSGVAWKRETSLTAARLVVSRGIRPCNLRHTNLSGTYLSNTNFASADLTEANLSSCQAIDTVDFRYGEERYPDSLGDAGPDRKMHRRVFMTDER